MSNLIDLSPKTRLKPLLPVILLTALLLFFGAVDRAAADGVADGTAGAYDFKGTNCDEGEEHSDPVGTLFRGKWAGPTNVSAYIGDPHPYLYWHYTENYGAQALLVRQKDGSWGCSVNGFANAEAATIGPYSRFHVRLWNVPGAIGPWGAREVETISTPHHEQYVPTPENTHCHGPEISLPIIGGTSLYIPSGNHAIYAEGVRGDEPGSGFDQGRHKLTLGFQATGFETESEYWGNYHPFEQCNGWKAGSDGYGTIIWVNRNMHIHSEHARHIARKAADVSALLKTGEATTKAWFGWGPQSSQGVNGYAHKTSAQSIVGASETTVSTSLSELGEASTYYVRMFAENPEGEIEEGEEIHFTTCGTSLNPSAAASNPRALASCHGTMDVFYRTPTGELGHDWYDTGGLGWLSGNLPGSVASAPDAVAQENGTIDVFYRTPSGELGHNWYDTGKLGWLSGNLPGPVASPPDAVVRPNGTIDVFFRTPNGELGHDWFDVGGSGWHSGNLPGTVASNPRAVAQANGTIDVFYRTPGGAIAHNWYDTGGLGWQLGTIPGSIAPNAEPQPLVQPKGTIDVFFRTPGGELGHDWFDTGGSGWLSGNLAGSLASDAEPHPTVQPNGTIDVVFRTSAKELGHDWFNTGGSGWNAGTLPGTVESEPAAVAQPNGTVDVLYRTLNQELGHNWFDPGTGWLSGNLPAVAGSAPQVTAQYNGTIDVFYRTAAGQLGHNWYDTGGLGWQAGPLPGTIDGKPEANTLPATVVESSGAVLNATVRSEEVGSTYYFEYGKTTSYGSKVPATASSLNASPGNVFVSKEVGSLSPVTTYHFRVVATNAAGATYGADHVFTTSHAIRWLLKNSLSAGNADLSFYFGTAGQTPVVGDWNGDGVATPGTYEPATGTWRLRNSNTPGPADLVFAYGASNYVPVVGDWNGDGKDTVGVYEPATGTWRLRNANTPGNPEIIFAYGASNFLPVAGDWDGNGTDTAGLYVPAGGQWYLRNSNTAGNADIYLAYGATNMSPIVGDWNGNKTDTIGVYIPSSGEWLLRNANTAGNPEIYFAYGASNFAPLAGDWNGDGTETEGLAVAE